MSTLTIEEAELFDALRNPKYKNFILVEGEGAKGERNVYICLVLKGTPHDDMSIMTPVFKMVDDSDIAHLIESGMQLKTVKGVEEPPELDESEKEVSSAMYEKRGKTIQ